MSSGNFRDQATLHTSGAAERYRLGLASQARGELEPAKEHFLAVLKDDPQHADAMHALANIDARERRFADAERLVRRAIALNPMQALYFNSLGNVLRALNRREEAAAVYRQALRLKPDLALVYANLGALALEDGEPKEAADLCLKALEIDPNSAMAYCNLGRALNNLGKLEEAADAFRRALKVQPDFALAHNYLGHVHRARGDLERARAAFERALEIDPELAVARRNLGTMHMAAGEVPKALECFREAVRLDPSDVRAHIHSGIALHTLGRVVKATQSYRAALELDPGNAEARLNLGIVQNELRQVDEAESALKQALEAEPDNSRGWAELAALYEDTNRLEDMGVAVARALELAPDDPRVNLEAARYDRRTGSFDAAIERLQRLDLDGVPARLAQQMHYELGLLNDRRGDVDAAFRHFTEANRHGRASQRLRDVDPGRYLGRIDRLHAYFTDADPATWERPREIEREDAPVFLFGFPRSGTTLIDLLLDGHPRIRTVEEKPTLNAVMEALDARYEGGYPDALGRLSAGDLDDLRQVYLDALERHARREAGITLVDKLPIRTLHAGLVWRLYPSARIVFALRHPCDVCLSGFMQQYDSNDAFANFFSLEETVRIYDKVMSLWKLYVSRLELDCHVVRYERLIDDLEGQTRRLIRFLGLPWDDAALDYARRARERGRIWTNSYHQVSQPIYRHAAGRWRRYRKYFEPHLERLAPHARYFGYSVDDESGEPD